MGDRIDRDWHYRLYAGLIKKLPILKHIDWQLGGISGSIDDKFIKLDRRSELTIRCRLNDISEISSLDYQVIRIGQSLLELGSCEGEKLTYQQDLFARFVTIKICDRSVDEFNFGVSLGKQLQLLSINTCPTIGDRRVIKIKDKLVIGWSLQFSGLSANESIALQSQGIGGRRKLGGGVFLDRRKHPLI